MDSSLFSFSVTQILIVEDEYIIAANLQENLESLGYSVLGVASSAAGAIDKALALKPDIVLMDIRLQGERDGIHAAEQIWSLLQTPVIYLTGHSDKNTLDRAKITFPFGFILKPVKKQELYVAIETALNRYEREQFLSTVLQRMGDGVIVVDRQSRIKYLNQVAEVLTGWQQQEAADQNLMSVFNLIDEETKQPIENPVTPALQQRGIFYLGCRVLLITKEGTTLPISDSVACLTNNKGDLTGAVLVFRDDTQRQLQESRDLALQRTQLIERQMEEMQRLSQLKDDFLSTVSHELRTPLAAIKMAIQMLEISLNRRAASPLDLIADATSPDATSSPSNTQQVEQYLKILREQCEQELNLINDLLDLQYLGAQETPIALTPIDLTEWVPHIADAFQDQAQQRQQHLQVLLLPDLPLLVSDLTLFTRIVKELLTNACKYTPPGEAITVSAHPLPEKLQLRVSNSGVEIAEAELARIFDKFYRIPTNDRWNQGGTGLGLALIQKLVVYLGGRIWAESSSKQVHFIVELPILPPDTVAAGAE